MEQSGVGGWGEVARQEDGEIIFLSQVLVVSHLFSILLTLLLKVMPVRKQSGENCRLKFNAYGFTYTYVCNHDN